jgi:hypothetical protein
LGDIMAYRASGTGHLELVAGRFSINFSWKALFCSILVNTSVFICDLMLWFHDSLLGLLFVNKMISGRVFIVAEIQAVDCYFERTSRGSSWSYSRCYLISSICWSCLYSYLPHPSLHPIFIVSLHIVDMFSITSLSCSRCRDRCLILGGTLLCFPVFGSTGKVFWLHGLGLGNYIVSLLKILCSQYWDNCLEMNIMKWYF